MQRRKFLGRAFLGMTGAGMELVGSGTLGLLSAMTCSTAHAADTLKIGAMIPATGPAGLFGPSSKNCCLLAQDDINARGGILGKKIEVLFGDAGAGPEAATQTALKLWKGSGVSAFIGMHDSAVRGALTTMLRGQVPYFYTPTYEGGECSPGVYVNGETPAQQLAPVIPWLAQQRKLKRWYLIGNDYSWPRETNAIAKNVIASSAGSVVGEEYVPFSVDNFDASLAKIRASGADAVLITLVGGASVSFNRAFGGLGLSAGIVRLGTLIEENTLAGIGLQNAENLYSSAGYFAALQTEPAKAFATRYQARFKGPDAQLNSLAESCYEGFLMLDELAKRAGKISVPAFNAVSEGARYEGPRGVVEMRQRHVVEDVLVARASAGGFEIVKSFPKISAGQSCKV